jgi:hypothetical protein
MQRRDRRTKAPHHIRGRMIVARAAPVSGPRLAQEIDALEKHAREDDRELGRFKAVRSELSRTPERVPRRSTAIPGHCRAPV